MGRCARGWRQSGLPGWQSWRSVWALLPVDRLRAGVVARRHGQRQAQAVAASIRLQQFGVAEDDADGFACADVGDRGAEQVGAFLLDQTGLLAVVAGLLIGLAGLFALLNHTVDATLADFQRHAVHGRALAGRQYIAALGKGPAGVAEGLTNLHFSDRTADLDLHVGIEQQGGCQLPSSERKRNMPVSGLSVDA